MLRKKSLGIFSEQPPEVNPAVQFAAKLSSITDSSTFIVLLKYYLPMMAMACVLDSMLTKVNASFSDLVVKSQAAPGTSDCDGKSYCQPGYVANPAAQVIQRFYSIISPATSGSGSSYGTGNLGTTWWWNIKCMSPSQAGQALIDALLQNVSAIPTSPGNSCVVTSNSLYGTQMVSTYPDFDPSSPVCSSIQKFYTSQTQPCMDSGTASGYNWAIAAITVGIIVGIAGITLAVTCSLGRQCKKSC